METLFQHTTPGEYTVLTGEAPNAIERQKISIDGVISAPADYFTVKYASDIKSAISYYPGDMLVQYNIAKGTITFIENTFDTDGNKTITGKLNITPSVSDLGINAQKTYSPTGLSDVLKMNRVLFASKDEHMKVVADLAKLKVTFEQTVLNSDDKQGNKITLFEQTANAQPIKFKLQAPIFSHLNDDAVTVEVQVNIDVRDRAIVVWLESVELKEYLDINIYSIINNEVERFTINDKPIPSVQIG